MFLEEVFNPIENRPTVSDETMRVWHENRFGSDGQAIELPDDMSGQYNTQLTDEQEKQYSQWAKEQGREQDVQNYDLRGAWLEMQNNSAMSEDERGHLGDKYKKPNHPTFSAESIYNGKEGVQGGKWEQNGAIWSYTPGHKLTKDQAKRLEKYFQENEAGNYLNLKDKVYKDPALFVPGKTPGAFDGITDVLWKPMADAGMRLFSTGLMAASKGMFWVRDDFREQMAKASEDLDAWTRANLGPDPETMGTATQILYGLANTLPEIVLLMSGAGAAARLAFGAASAGFKVRTTQLAVGSALFGSDLGVAERNRLVNEGVDKDTAFKAGMISAGLNTIGVLIPPFLGASRIQSAIYGATSNVGLNYAEIKTIQTVLENQNYNELAQQYQLGLTDSTVSGVLGAVMGAAFWRSPTQVKFDRAYNRLYDRYRSDIAAGGKFTKEQSAVNADINSRAVISLAKMSGVSPDKIDDFAAKITWSEDGKSLSVPAEYAMKIAENIETRYNEAIAKGDMVTAEALVKEYAKTRGYNLDDDYRDMHSAPRASVAKEDFTNLDKLREVAKESGDVNIFAIANDVSIVPSDFFASDGWWQYSNRNEAADNESFYKIRKAIDSIQRQTKEYGRVKHMPTVWVYRAVPKSVKEGKLQSDGQWVTPSVAYAKLHGQSRFGFGEYRIIKEAVPADQLWFNGDSINEWGFDNGEKYVYKNTTNNRKRYDAIVRDFDGNIVPLSKRFNSRKWEEFYQIKSDEMLPYERKLALEDIAWKKFVNGLTSKPTGNVVMLRQLPLVFNLIGYKGKIEANELRASPHLFDGLLAINDVNYKGQNAHRNIDKAVLSQLPRAIAEPIAVFRRFGASENEFIFMVDIKDKAGGTVIVPIGINMREGFLMANVVKTAYTKTSSRTGKPDNDWFSRMMTTKAIGAKNGEMSLTPVYADLDKVNRWNTSSGSHSHSVLSNGLFRNVKTKDDLVKLRETRGNEYYQVAYHGSPYLFDAFTLAHIGSGEGAQAHGYGLYFALARMRAQRYREMLAGAEYKIDGQDINEFRAGLERSVNEAKNAKEKKRLRERLEAFDEFYAHKNEADVKTAYEEGTVSKQAYKWFESEIRPKVKGQGHLYTAEIPDDNILLREERTFDEQPKEVQDAIKNLFEKEFTAEQRDNFYREQWYNEAMEQMRDYTYEFEVPSVVLQALDKLAKDEGPQIFADEKKVLKKISKAINEAAEEKYQADKEWYEGQSKKEALKEIKEEIIEQGGLDADGLFYTILDVAESKYPSLLTGESKFEITDSLRGRDLYTKIAEFVGGEKEASELLNKYGVKGIRYTGLEDGECAVIWDEKSINILEYLQKGEEGIRGAFNPSTNTIRLTPNANLSTFSHEHSHWYLTNVLSLAGKDGATLELQTQSNAILQVFGIKSLDEWNALGFEGQRKYQEQFAAWTELYLTQGKSPVPGLEGVFKKFADWLLDMYKTMLGKDADSKAQAKEISDRYEAQFGEKLPELSPEVRKVLDKMYGAQEKFVPTKGQTAAARLTQATRVNSDKISAPMENPTSPQTMNTAVAMQGKAESDLNTGNKVDLSGTVGDAPANTPAIHEAQRSIARAVAVGDGDQSRAVVLQNRDRSSPTSVAQMNSIAADPQYGRLSVSRTTQSGAPIVSFGQVPDQAYQGKSDVITESNGNRVPVTYFVVEADTVMRSNNIDGTPNPQWNEAHPESMRAVAGNGRMAGLAEAYNRGTAEKYREELIADEGSHGVSADVIRGMKKPVLVRYMAPDDVTTGFVERSNTSDVLVRSALETAMQDSPKVRNNIDKYDFDENGDPTRETLGQFLTDVGETSEMGNLLGSDGQPTTTARNRIRAALFYEAYRDGRLTELVADSEDKQGLKRILNAMSAFAPRVIEIREASNGAIDLGPVITGAVNRILQAKINGEGVDFASQMDMFDNNPITDIFSQFFSNNKNSTAGMLRVLRPFADDVQNRLRAADSPLFAEEAVQTDMADAMQLFRKAENNELRSKSGDLLGDSTENLLPDVDVEAIRSSIARTVPQATELVSSIAQGAQEANIAATPEAKAMKLNEHLAEQARAREVLSENSEAARARNMVLDDAERVVTIQDANGNPIQMRAADLLEQTQAMDKELENDVSGLGTGVACIIRNQGIRS